MKKLLILSIIVLITSCTYSVSYAEASMDEVHIYSLEVQSEDMFVVYEGINISLVDKLSKILILFQELDGRDVDMYIHISTYFISYDIIKSARINGDTVLNLIPGENETVINFIIMSYQTVTLEVPKSEFIYEAIKQTSHSFWSYAEYSNTPTDDSKEVTVVIDKTESLPTLENDQVIVQYKTDFFGWYYPIEADENDDIHYNIGNTNTQYSITTNFKESNSSSVKIYAFEDDGTIRGKIAKIGVSLKVGIKKLIMDIFM